MASGRKHYLIKFFNFWVVIFVSAGAFATFAKADSDIGGLTYCGKGIAKTALYKGIVDFPSSMGAPETWSKLERVDVLKSITHEDNKLELNIDTNVVPSSVKLRLKDQYIFPCAILKNEADWRQYWLNDHAAKLRIVILKSGYEKYMDCLYDHRKEMNKWNKKIIEHVCKKKVRWKPLGAGSVAQEAIE
jgi:hypothetical protein